MEVKVDITPAAPIEEQRILGAVHKGTYSALSRFGAYTRRVAMNSIKYVTSKRQKSRPGEPPVAHRLNAFTKLKFNRRTAIQTRQPSSPLRELIAFAVVDDTPNGNDMGSSYVVVGPMIFRGSRIGGGNVTRTLERGGVGQVRDPKTGAIKIARFSPRPYMSPAFKATLPKAPKLFERIIH